MSIKTATLLAIIGNGIHLIYWQLSSFLKWNQAIVDKYRDNTEAMEMMFSTINLGAGLCSSGTLILFLITLYSKQK
jgi:hypothetical protein